ncbi:uncharacterized protein UBRO2_01466 [Ustilago bromivora]|uniref:Homeobox domain-containing protein n=1 Tax=Ustilago bromivora TaxID=307758 RepID=A0A8H8TR82_9BASI|nr:uncharacterized protein UBRO2_01466 [Ustilago bromivora]
MLLCSDDDDDEDGDNWSRAGSEGKHRQGSTGSAGTGGRSRRLLSVQQSKVLYKILEKLREQVATQLNVSPRKVQVWFQNRRQVGKKRMMEAVQSALPPHRPYSHSPHPASNAPSITLEMLRERLKATGKGRFNPALEDERTRAWRRHTIRLALNPGAVEAEESLFALERRVREGPRNRGIHGVARGVREGLRINVPPPTLGVGLGAGKTPLYTGPGSASHLETLSRVGGAGLMTPAVPGNSIVPPPVSSQKDGEGGMREVRGNLTVEWHLKQQQLHSRPPQLYRSHPGPIRGIHSHHPTPTPAGAGAGAGAGLRYRSSTDTLSRLPPLPSTPRPPRDGNAAGVRYSPYSRTPELPPPPPPPPPPHPSNPNRVTGASLHPLPPSFSLGAATTATTASLRWAGSARLDTPSTASSSRSPPTSLVLAKHSVEHTEHDTPSDTQEKLHLHTDTQCKTSRANVMDVRSLTTSNLANVGASRSGSPRERDRQGESKGRISASSA